MENEIYLTDKQVSEITGRAVQTLRNDRHRGQGIPYIKRGAMVRYSRSDVLQFMESGRVKVGPI